MSTEPSGAVESPSSLPRRAALLTFLIADVRGYTRFTLEQGDEAAARLAGKFAAIAREIAAARDGEVIELRGDEALAVFPSSRQALHAALDLQKRFGQETATDPSLPLPVGIGLDAGDAIPVEGGYRGGALNLAARLCSIAGAGEVFCSDTVIGLARKTEGIAFVDRGEVALKGLAAPVRVTQIAPEGELPADVPPLQPLLVTHPNNLSDEPTPFIGREWEIDQIASLLHDPHIRLVTLTGPGGTGKTRLALQVGSTLLHDYREGVLFVNLASLADPALVPSAIAEVLTVKEEADTELVASLVAAVRDKHLLLVLDNFEHLLDASAVVSSLLDSCHQLQVLVTSRIPLHLSREHEYLVPPLSVPDPAHLPDVEHLSQYEAVALFIERARAVRADFAVTNGNASAVAEICARLDGLPLAIELAAARIKLFPPQALLARLGQSLQLLTGGPRDKPTRQQTLRGAIDWSYSLLSDEEQVLLARLSVFVGGWSLEAAEAVCNSQGLDVLEGLGSLVDKSLVRQEGEEEPRFRMLETIREYAVGKLDERGEREQLRRAHAEYALTVTEEVSGDRGRAASARSLDRLDAELDNVRAALHWAGDRGGVQLGLQVAVAMTNFWERRGHLTEGRRWLQDLLSEPQTIDARTKAFGFKAASRLAFAQHDMLSARALGRESLAAFQELGNRREMADVLDQLGVTHMSLSDFAEAVRTLEDALALARESGDRPLLGRTLASLSWARALEDDLARAGELGEEGLELSRDLDDVEGMAWSLDALLYIARLRGDMQRARSAFAEYVALLERRDFQPDPAHRDSIERLAIAARSWGDYEASRAVLEKAMSLSLEAEDKQAAAYILVGLALIEREQGRFGRATELLEESLKIFRASDDAYGIGRALLGQADVARDRGDGAAAIAFGQESLVLHRKLGESVVIGFSLNDVAMGAFQQGDYDRADALLQEALQLCLPGETRAEIVTNMGLVALARGEYERAGECFADALHAGRAGDMIWLTPLDLEGMGMVAAGLERPQRAARLFGAASAQHRKSGTPVRPAIRSLYDRYVAEARSALGDQAFAAVWREGEVLSFEQALALVQVESSKG